MPIRIVRDYPYGQTRSAFARIIRAFFGSILVFVGLIGSVIAVPTGFIALADIVNSFQKVPVELFSPDFPVRELEAAFVVAALVASYGLRYGRQLIRGRRSMVLFLRRFGYRGSMQAVTYAVVNTIGNAWRLVTLDDAEIAPVGVASVPRLAFGIGSWLWNVAWVAGRGVFICLRWAYGAMWLIVGLQVAQVAAFGDWRRVLRDGTVEPYVYVVTSVMKGRVPWESFALTLPGLFAVFFVISLALGFVALLIMMGGSLLYVLFTGFLNLAASSADAVQKAETAKTQAISHPGEVRDAVGTAVEHGRQTFAPRLVVLRVATPAWRETVSALAAITSASIVDISEPTEHLAWELGELERLCPGRWIAIGEHDRITRWREPTSPPDDPTSLDARFARLLGSRDVLAYTIDRRGMRRFARALHGMLLDLQDRPDRQ